MLVTASWGGADVAVEVDAECRSVDGLKRCLQEALPKLDVETMRLEVCGRPVDDEAVLSLVAGSVVDVSASQAALAADTLREEGCAVDLEGFCAAACTDSVRRCKLYLKAGVIWPTGVSNPLHIAVWREQRELCELLLASGRDKDAKGEKGETPLHITLWDNRGCMERPYRLEIAKLLLDSGCDPDVKNNEGETLLHRTIDMDDIQLCKLLLDSGCDKDAKNDMGNTPLHCAVWRGDVQKAKLLLDSGCEKDKPDNIGNTSLHLAVARKHVELAKLLVDSGCSTSVRNNRGKTPLGVAC